MRIKGVSHWCITVELTPLDAVTLADLVRVGSGELLEQAHPSRLLVPRVAYYEALGAALTAAAMASVGVGCLPQGYVADYNRALEEVGIGD